MTITRTERPRSANCRGALSGEWSWKRAFFLVCACFYVRFRSPLQLGRQTSTVNCMCRLHEQERKAAARRRLGDLDAKLGVRNPHGNNRDDLVTKSVCPQAAGFSHTRCTQPALAAFSCFFLAFAGCSTRAGQQPAPTGAAARVVLTEAQPISARSNRRSHSENRHADQSFTPPGTAVAFLPVIRICSVRTWPAGLDNGRSSSFSARTVRTTA